MARRPQVRLDPDVAEALQAVADQAGHSLAQAANLLLRRTLGLDIDRTAPAQAQPEPRTAPPAPARVHAPTGLLASRPGVAEAAKRADQHRRARSQRR